jgi:hypothetical protein
MARKKMSAAASECISHEIERHCRKKRGKCKLPKERKQAIAISYSMCKRKGFRSIPKAPRK